MEWRYYAPHDHASLAPLCSASPPRDMGVDPPPGNVPRSLLLPPSTSIRSVLAVALQLTRAATFAVAVDGGVTVGRQGGGFAPSCTRLFCSSFSPACPILYIYCDARTLKRYRSCPRRRPPLMRIVKATNE